ncbi:hypothetical protein [Microlunatus flavus]|uniref:Uncharacterized protein n=1 Tax=Microlunatus flavus TaxID=1036181 RepID=A0A1H9LL94_9ACTN|nr:hypothetical protein [Microlunatus flavus]SER12282.1 hypothetical protein SAMN05421756_10912 [Microlunatus flavus]
MSLDPTRTPAPGGPDLTPTKSLPEPNGSWIGSGGTSSNRAADSGNKIANWMMICGIAASILGAILWVANQDYGGNAAWAQFGLIISVNGEAVALLGLLARAIRAPRGPGVTD